MADNRKSHCTLLLTNRGKKSVKVEIFKGEQFSDCPENTPAAFGKTVKLFRLRIDGSWYPKGERKFYYKGKIESIVFSLMNL